MSIAIEVIHKKLGSFFSKCIADESKRQRPEISDALAGGVQGVGFSIVAISVVVIGHLDADDTSVETIVRKELVEWFGPAVGDWRHLKTYRIVHALPEQSPPMPDPIKFQLVFLLNITTR